MQEVEVTPPEVTPKSCYSVREKDPLFDTGMEGDDRELEVQSANVLRILKVEEKDSAMTLSE